MSWLVHQVYVQQADAMGTDSLLGTGTGHVVANIDALAICHDFHCR